MSQNDQKQNQWAYVSPDPNYSQYSWRAKRNSEAVAQIRRWDRRFLGDTKTVRLFVEDALVSTRSPGKREVYLTWLVDHPKPPELIPSIWAGVVEESLRIRPPLYTQLEFPAEFLNDAVTQEEAVRRAEEFDTITVCDLSHSATSKEHTFTDYVPEGN